MEIILVVLTVPGIHVSCPTRVLGMCSFSFSFCSSGFPKGPWLGNMKRGKKPDLSHAAFVCQERSLKLPMLTNFLCMAKWEESVGCRVKSATAFFWAAQSLRCTTLIQSLCPLRPGCCCKFWQNAWELQGSVCRDPLARESRHPGAPTNQLNMNF